MKDEYKWVTDCECNKYDECVYFGNLDFENMSNDEISRYYIHINPVIRRSKKHNFQYCRFPVPITWDVDRFEKLLEGYHDAEIIQFMRFGWPVETEHLIESDTIPPNQQGARNNPGDLDKYISDELSQKSIIGPFSENMFGKTARFSPIDAIPKKDTTEKRVIINLSHPDGTSVNDAISKDKYLGVETCLTYPTVDDLAQLILRAGVGAAMFKTDLKKYFRQVCYDPGCIHLMGFRVANNLYWDICLTMGLRISCYIAQRISSALIYIYRKRGYKGLNYIDDLAGVETWSKAYQAYRALIELLQEIKVWEATHKRCEPDVSMSFLGVSVNSIQLKLSLTVARLAEIKEICNEWLHKCTASCKDVQRLVGKLNFAAATVKSGRLFFSRILTYMKLLPKHGVRKIDSEVRKDISWWTHFIEQFNGVSFITEMQWRTVDSEISCDACLKGLGGFHEGEYYHCLVPRRFSKDKHIHINELECLAIVVALKVWAEKLTGMRIEAEERAARLEILATICYHHEYLDISELKQQYGATMQRVERGAAAWSDKLADRLHADLAFRASVNNRQASEKTNKTTTPTSTPATKDKKVESGFSCIVTISVPSRW